MGSVNEVTIAVVLDGMDLTDAQWAILEPLFRPTRRPDGRGRPWAETRAVLNGVLWILRTGAPWHDLPRRYPPYQTCHRRFRRGNSGCGSSAVPKCRRSRNGWRQRLVSPKTLGRTKASACRAAGWWPKH